jgi:hypothetical protein
MPLPVPNLDDRTFADLVAEGRALIPRLAPEWTNHNPSDPGITLVELFAYLTELLIYRLNQVTDDNVRSFLRLLNGRDWTPSGSGPDALARDVRATILSLRHRERAVTAEDYEALAIEADARVQRVRCVPRRDLAMDLDLERPASLSVVVVPRPAGERFFRVDRIPLAGTVHTAGAPSTELNGVGTSFTSAADVGDTLEIAGAGTRTVMSVTSDTLLTLDAAVNVGGPPGVSAVRIDLLPLSGTVHTCGSATTALTGVGTVFRRELMPTGTLAISRQDAPNGGTRIDMRGVTAIGSDTALTLDAPITIAGPADASDVLGTVRAYLEPRRLLTARVTVIGPQYLTVRVRVGVAAPGKLRPLDVKREVVDTVMQFLDPIGGGPDGQGWPFGRPVFVSELYEVLERLADVDHVTVITVAAADTSRELRDGGELVGIALRAHELPSPQITRHDVVVQVA